MPGWDASQFAVLGAAAVGAAGASLAGYLISGRQSKSEFQLAMRAARVTAYEEALRLCEHMFNWAVRTYPIWEEGSSPDVAVSPVDDQIRARVLVNLHGSPDVRVQYQEFEWADTAFWIKAMEIRRDTAGQRPKLRLELEECRNEIRMSLDPLESAMREDVDLLPGSTRAYTTHTNQPNVG
jgi:hypothetical protein